MNNKPVAWMVDEVLFNSLGVALNISFDIKQPCIPLYTHPVKELTEWEIEECWDEATGMQEHFCSQYFDFAQLILRKAQENG